MAYARDFEELRHEIWRSDPHRFRHLSQDRYSSSISSRHEVLAHIVRDSHGILVTASHMGVCEEPLALAVTEIRSTARAVKLLRDPMIQDAVAVVAGGIIYYLGWTR